MSAASNAPASAEDRHRRYQQLFEAVPDGYILTDPHGLILEANEAAVALVGSSDLIGRPLAAFVAAPHHEIFHRHLRDATSSNGDPTSGIEIDLHDDPVLPVDLRARSVTSDDGVTTIGWQVRDRRSKLETDELRRAVQQLRTLFDTARVGIVLWDSSLTALFSNREALRLLGGGEDAVIDGVHPSDQQRVRTALRRTLRDGTALQLRHRVGTAEDQPRWVDHGALALRSANSTISGCVSTVTEVTAEHLATERLQRSQAFNETVADTVAALIVVLDTTGVVRRVNPAVERLSGRTAAELIGRSLVETVVATEDVTATSAAIQELRTRDTNSVENTWITADGARRQIAWTQSALRTEEGVIWAIVATGTDLTERNRLQVQSTQAARLESAGRVAAGVGHDLNNLLAVVMARTERLGRRARTQEDREDVEALRRAGTHALDLVADLGRVAGRGDRAPPGRVDIEEHLRLLGPLMDDVCGPNIQLDVVSHGGAAVVVADPAQLERSMLNIVVNACDAIDGSGTIQVTVEHVHLDGSGSGPPGTSAGEYVMIAIADDGPGISAEDLPQILEPYYTTKGDRGSSGLGLPLSLSAMRDWGGTLTVDSEFGAGSTVQMWLPVVFE